MTTNTNATTDGLAQDEATGLAFDADEETVGDEWVGQALYASWGYNQTSVEFARIVRVSDSGRTVFCRMASADRVGTSKGSETVEAGDDTYGDEFSLRVRVAAGDVAFRGSYPYINGEMDEGKRLDTLYPVGDREGVHQTAPGYGH